MTKEEAINLLSNYFNWCPDCVDNEHAENHSRDCDKCMCKATKLAVEALEKQKEENLGRQTFLTREEAENYNIYKDWEI